MRLSQLDDKYKVFEVKLINGETFYLTGEELFKFLKSHLQFYKTPNGEGFSKTSISSWKIDIEKTKENIIKNKPKLLNKNYEN